MDGEISVLIIAFAIMAFIQPAYAKQAEKVYRVGYPGNAG